MKKHDPPSTKKVYNFLEDCQEIKDHLQSQGIDLDVALGTGEESFIPGQTSNFKVNQKIEKYRLLQELGKGGMGKVYLAYDTTVQRKVVLKFILRDIPKNLKRFLREAEAASALKHSNIVEVYRVFFYKEKPCIVMEYVEGETLSDYASTHSLSIEQQLNLIRKIALSLHYAHRKKIIHRDVKPANIIIDKEEEPYLMDFGLAKISNVDKSMTKTGEIMGSPGYMSPEQAKGQRNLTARTDIYSLGAVMYWFLTGVPLFETDNLMSFLYSVVHENPKLPRKINNKIPHEVERICLKSTHKNPKMRYSSCKAMAEDIQSFLSGKNNAFTAAIRYQAQKFQRRRYARYTIIIISIVVLAYVITLEVFRPRIEKNAEYYNNLDSETLLGDALLEKALFHYKQKEYYKAELDYNLAIRKRPDNAQAYYQRANLFKDLLSFDKAENDYNQALELEPNLEIYYSRADLYYQKGLLEKALEEYQKILDKKPLYYKALIGIGNVLAETRPSQAKEYFSRALDIAPDDFYVNLSCGIFYKKINEIGQAKNCFKSCIMQGPRGGECYWLFAQCFEIENNYSGAANLYEESLNKEPNISKYIYLGDLYLKK